MILNSFLFSLSLLFNTDKQRLFHHDCGINGTSKFNTEIIFRVKRDSKWSLLLTKCWNSSWINGNINR